MCDILIWNNSSFAPSHLYPNMTVYFNVKRKCVACNSIRWQFERHKIKCGRMNGKNIENGGRDEKNNILVSFARLLKSRAIEQRSSDLIRFINVCVCLFFFMVCMLNTDDELKKGNGHTHQNENNAHSFQSAIKSQKQTKCAELFFWHGVEQSYDHHSRWLRTTTIWKERAHTRFACKEIERSPFCQYNSIYSI